MDPITAFFVCAFFPAIVKGLILSMIKDKKILLGITGSIAAYKSILLLRGLVKAGAEVKVVMTPAARATHAGFAFNVLTMAAPLSAFRNAG